MPSTSEAWSDPQQGAALVDHLRFLCSDEGLSFGVIAERLGVTRSAAIGKAHRLHLNQPRKTITRHDVNRAVRQRVSAPKVAPKPATWGDPHAHYCTIWQLTNESCRYPMWHDETPEIERLYCGVPEANLSTKQPYCRKHSKFGTKPDRYSSVER